MAGPRTPLARYTAGPLLLSFIACLCGSAMLATAASDLALQVTKVNETSITVTWTAIINVTEYNVSYTNGSDTQQKTVTGTQYSIPDLLPGVKYTITVSFLNENGTSESKTTTETTRPSVVGGVTVSTISEKELNVSWRTSADVNGATYTYNVTVKGPTNTYMLVNATTSSAVVNNLEPGANYSIIIYAITQDGVSSSPSNIVIGTTRPSVVEGVTASSRSDTELNISWRKSADANGASYTYNVTVTGPNNSYKDVHADTNSAVVTDLNPGTNYSIKVYAVTQNGVSSLPSNIIIGTTLPSVVTGLQASNINESSVTLAWTLSSDQFASHYTYTVEVLNKENFTGITDSPKVVTNLSAGVTYSFIVFAVTENLISSNPSIIYNVTTWPSVVEGVNVSSRSDTELNVSWMKSADVNGTSYTYNVTVRGPNNSYKAVHVNTSSAVVDNLKPGESYNITVYAVTVNGVSSSPSKIVIGTTLPSVVTGLQASNVTESSVTLAWTLSNDTFASHYTYTVEVLNKESFTGLINSPKVVTNLSAGVTYSFIVFAVTENFISSNPSIIYNVTTHPSVVEGVTVSTISEKVLNVSWRTSADVKRATYTYNITVEGPNNTYVVVNATTSSAVVNDLVPGANYSITVYAVTQNGISSSPSNIVIGTTLPSVVTGLKASSVNNNSVTLEWTLSQDMFASHYTYTVEVLNKESLTGITDSPKVVTNLSAGVPYSFIVFAVTKNLISSNPSIIYIATTLPNEPQNLVGVPTGISEIAVNWNAPGDVNAKLYDYQVKWGNEKLGISGLNTTKNTSFTIKELSPGNQYTISVTSVINKILSVDAVIKQLTNPISTNNLVVVSITNTTATLKWEQDISVNSSVSGYVIEVRLNGSSTVIRTQDTSNRTIALGSLEPGNVYDFTVKSFASPLQSRSQGIAPGSTFSTPISVKAETEPDHVREPKCLKVDGYQLTVEFKCPYGSFSVLKILVDGDSKNEILTCTNSVSAKVTGLQPARSYSIEVETLAKEKSVFTSIPDCYTDSTAVIVGSVLGILIFLLIIGIIVFFVMRKRRSKGTSEHMYIPQLRFHTVTKEKFPQHYNKKHADSDFGFAEEYQELHSVGITQSKKAAELPENRAKNRFTNVLPYDHSRVKLSIIEGISSTDYINADYMPGYNSTKEFIASQGPLPNTTADFWRMVWEHHIDTIVMLTNCMENGRVKCERYWPLDYTPCTYGDITVTVTSETILPEWTIRDFSVKHARLPGVKSIRHFHFTAWPDHGVPDSSSSIIQFRNLVRDHMDQRKSAGPTIVHCSAGVGRTGTLIALDYLIQQMEREHRIGVYGFVNKMRINRPLMVQTEAQYIFLNKCMLDLIDQPPEEPIYENQGGTELIYENAAVVRNFQKENPQL